MTEEPNPPSTNGSAAGRSWFDRISQIFSSELRDRTELVDTLREARNRGLIGDDALGMIEGAIEVADMQVRDIMIPRAEMDVVPRDATPEQILPVIIESGHSRFPVVGDTRDDVVGILLAKDLLRYFAEGGAGFDLKEVIRSPVVVPESKRLNVMLREFRLSRNHMAIVVDEYGGVAGLVTIEDVLEQIVGEIDDEHDYEEDDDEIRRHGPNRYTVKARTGIEEFNSYFQCELSTSEFDTVGGLVTKALGHLPRRGETVIIEGFEFKVLRAGSRRVHLLRVTLTPGTAEDGPLAEGH
ncbi:MAG: HlyC/CorC family transporter [Gammaproteobacteria bacterium]